MIVRTRAPGTAEHTPSVHLSGEIAVGALCILEILPDFHALESEADTWVLPLSPGRHLTARVIVAAVLKFLIAQSDPRHLGAMPSQRG